MLELSYYIAISWFGLHYFVFLCLNFGDRMGRASNNASKILNIMAYIGIFLSIVAWLGDVTQPAWILFIAGLDSVLLARVNLKIAYYFNLTWIIIICVQFVVAIIEDFV